MIVDPSGVPTGARVVQRELDGLENRSDRLRLSFLRTFGILAGGAGLVGAVRQLADFEQELANAGAIAGATEKQMVELRDAAVDLGATTRFSATQAAEGLGLLARAGFTVGQSIAAIDDTLRLAQVGELELAAAAEITTNVLSGFNLGVEDATHVVDVLAKAANASNTDVRELGDAFKFVAPVAAGVGVSIEEAAAAIGKLSDAGLKGSLAGTGLRRVISELENPSQKAREVLGDLGLTTDDVRISSVGLAGALSALNKAGLSASQALEVFGDRGGPAAIVLGKAADGAVKLTNELKNVDGFAAKTAARMDDNLKGSLLRVKNAFEQVVLAVGQAGATNGLRNVLEGVREVLLFVAKNADVLAAAAKNLAILLGPRALLSAIKALTTVLAANPFVALATGAALLIASIPELQQKLDEFVQFLVATVGPELASVFDFKQRALEVAQFIDSAVALFNGFAAAAGAAFDSLFTKPAAFGELMVKGIRDGVEHSLDFIFAFAQTVGDVLIGIGKDFVSLVQNIGGAAGAISTGSVDAAAAFADNMSSAIDRTANRIATFTGTLRGNLKALNEAQLLPEVKLSQDAANLGRVIGGEFDRGVAESTPSAENAIRALLGPQEALEKAAAVSGEAVGNAARKAAGVDQLGAGDQLSARATELQRELDVTRKMREEEAALNELLAKRPDLQAQIENALLDVQIAALETSTTLGDGFERAFLKISKEANDLASVAEAAVNSFVDHATDAIVEFVQTGTFNFKQFASAVLDDITRILVRLLILQAIQAVTGLGPAAAAGGAGAAIPGLGGARAEGGPVQGGRSYLVGEDGPELFTPSKSGTITPNGGAPAGATPDVHVQVVNVTSEDQVPQAIGSGKADEAIINVLHRNRDRVQQITRS